MFSVFEKDSGRWIGRLGPWEPHGWPGKEVGWGIVPMHPVSRLFADEQGRLNQRVAAVCDQVTLVAAGLPLSLKSAAG